MALKYGDGVKIYEGIPLKQWKNGQTRRIIIVDEGGTFPHSEYGESFVYTCLRVEEGFDPNKKWTLFIRPNSALYYGALQVLTKERPTLEGRTFDITKHTGKEQKETRYDFVEVFKGD